MKSQLSTMGLGSASFLLYHCLLGPGLVKSSGSVFIHVKRMCLLPSAEPKGAAVGGGGGGGGGVPEAAAAAEAVEVAEEVVEILAEVDHPVWEDCFRLECRS